ncbi:MAG: hypothetical protein ACP5GH_02040 [Nitrososphaeria archaeon]
MKRFRTRYVLALVDDADPKRILEALNSAIATLGGESLVYRVEARIVGLFGRNRVLLKFNYQEARKEDLLFAVFLMRRFGVRAVPLRTFGTIKSAKEKARNLKTKL